VYRYNFEPPPPDTAGGDYDGLAADSWLRTSPIVSNPPNRWHDRLRVQTLDGFGMGKAFQWIAADGQKTMSSQVRTKYSTQ
jgi:hypothetical protein